MKNNLYSLFVLQIVLLSPIVLLAELPQNLDEYLFGQTGGTNYVQWMATEGEMNFVRPFAVFDKAEFRSSHPTNDMLPLHYSIVMQKTIREGDVENVLQMFKNVEARLSCEFRSAKFICETEGSAYCSVCKNIDGLGWDITLSIVKGRSDSLAARIFLFNSLHKTGWFVSCEDIEIVENTCQSDISHPTTGDENKLKQDVLIEPSLMPQCTNVVSGEMSGMTFKWATCCPRGWGRMGSMGHGEFLGYSFGRTIYQSTNDTVKTMNSLAFLVTETQPQKSDLFQLGPAQIESVFLWCVKDSNQLACVEFLTSPIKTDGVKDLISTIRKAISFRFSLDPVLVPTDSLHEDIDVTGPVYWVDDQKFSIRVSTRPSPDMSVRIHVMVICKEIIFDDIRHSTTHDEHFKTSNSITTNDVEVSVDGL